jgi:hypothetical protein
LAEFGVGEVSEVRNVFKEGNLQFGHGVEPKEIEPSHTKVRAFDGPVVKAGDTEGASITDAAAEDFPGIAEVVAVLPNDACHVAEVAWFAIEQTEGDKAAKTAIFLDLMSGHWWRS